jgi:hypothetical protein
MRTITGKLCRPRIARMHFAWVLLLLVPLAGCGGGGSDDPPPAPPPAPPAPPAPPPPNPPAIPPQSATAVSIDDGHAVGVDHWPEGATPDGGQGQDVQGVTCTDPDTTIHIHSHLSIFLNGEALAIPAEIGIVETMTTDCVYALHTHDKSGMIHLEGPVPTTFTLGQFFGIWGQPLDRANIAGLSSLPVTVYLADDGVVTEHTGDLAAIELVSHREITIQVGTAITEVPNFTWTGD